MPAESIAASWREKLGSSVSAIFLAPGMRRADPDYYPLWLGNQILGGSGLTSRLTAELREKRGLVYSAYSHFAPYALEGPFVVGAQTQRGPRVMVVDLNKSNRPTISRMIWMIITGISRGKYCRRMSKTGLACMVFSLCIWMGNNGEFVRAALAVGRVFCEG